MNFKDLKEKWESNQNFRIGAAIVAMIPLAFVVVPMIHKSDYSIPDRDATKIEKVYTPTAIEAQLEVRDIAAVREELSKISKIEKQANATNDNYELDLLRQDIEQMRKDIATQHAEINDWRTGKKRLERINYDPNQITDGRMGRTTSMDPPQTQVPSTQGTPVPQSAKPKPKAAPPIAGIRSVDEANDAILLQNGQVKTLVEANQIMDESTELNASQRRAKMDEREKKLAASLANARQKPQSKGYSISLPTTSLVTGTLLSGMQAPTAIGASREPLPSVMRIKVDALLPNNYRADLRDCQALLSGFGQLSDRRAYMRLEKVVCIDEDGLTAEAAAQGFATGKDGSAGIPGTLIARNSEVLKGSMWAGFFSGLAKGIAPNRVVGVDIGESDGFQTPDLTAMGASAALNGGSTALDKIADYYVQLLDEIWPTIQIDAMTEVTFILQAPLKLQFKET